MANRGRTSSLKGLSSHLSDNSNPIDLGILIDSSDSVAKKYWPKMLEFVSTIVDSFDISAGGTHVGLIVFSRDAEIPLYFNTLQGNNLTADNVKKFVSNLKYMEGWSRFDLAMSVTEDELFSGASGMRNGIPKVSMSIYFSASAQCSKFLDCHTPFSISDTNSASDVTILIRIVTQRKEQSGLVHLASFFLTFFRCDHYILSHIYLFSINRSYLS